MGRVCFGHMVRRQNRVVRQGVVEASPAQRATAPIEMETPHRTRDSVALSPSRSEAARSAPTMGNSLASPTTNSGQSTQFERSALGGRLSLLTDPLERRLAGAKASHESAQSS